MKKSGSDRYEIQELGAVKCYLRDMQAATFEEKFLGAKLVKDRKIPRGYRNNRTLGRYQGEVIFKWLNGRPICLMPNEFTDELIEAARALCKRGKGIESQVFYLDKADNILRVASSLDCFLIQV